MKHRYVYLLRLIGISAMLPLFLTLSACDNPRKFIGVSADSNSGSITILLDLCDKTTVVEFVEIYDEGISFGDTRGDKLLMRWEYPETVSEYRLTWQGEIPDIFVVRAKLRSIPVVRMDLFRAKDLHPMLVKVEADGRLYSETEFFARDSCESRGIFG